MLMSNFEFVDEIPKYNNNNNNNSSNNNNNDNNNL